MLNQMRRSASSWVVKALLGILVLSFGVWGIADVMRQGGGGRNVLVAGDTDVTVTDYQQAYQRDMMRLAQQLQRRPTPQEAEMFGLDQSVLSQLSASAVIDEEARRLGLAISDQGVLDLVQADPTFHDGNGNFSRNTLRAVLNNAGLTESAYLQDLRKTAVRNQLVQAISANATAPETFERAVGMYQGEKRTVNYVELAPQDAASIADPSQEQLASFFEQNKARYRAPEYRGFSYVVLSPSGLADPAAVSDEAIASYYEANKEQFTTPEQRHVRQAVFANREAADAAAAAIAGGASLDAAAADAKATVADLGLISKSSIPDKTLGEQAFQATLNRPTPVVDGMFGPTILEVTEIQPSQTRSLDEARDDIRKMLADNHAAEVLTTAYNSLNESLSSGASLAEAAQQANVTLQSVDQVDRNGNGPNGQALPNLPGGNAFLQALFSAEPGTQVTPVNFDGNSYVFFDLGQITPDREQKLEEVRDQVLTEWKTDEAQRLLTERANALQARVEGGESLSDAATAENLPMQIATDVTRSSGPATLGQAATQAAFAGPLNSSAVADALNPANRIVLQVAAVTAPTDAVADLPPEAKAQFDDALQNDVFQSFIARLQKDIGVTYNPSVVEQAKAGLR